LKRSLKLINKDSLEKVIWKAIQNDNFDPPQKKHLTFIITVLLGLNERIHQYQAFAKILDICYSTFQSTNWLQALKLCSLFHESF
jgi:flagellar biosynthesis regulator FlbT